MIKSVQQIGEALAITSPSIAQVADYLKDSGEHDNLSSTYVLTDPAIDDASFHGGEDPEDWDAERDELTYLEEVWTD